MKHQTGFSLVEIMIGMTLGLFLTIGIIQLYIGSNRNYRFQEEFSKIQENGRFALEVLNNSIRMTDFVGCSTSGETVNNVLNNNNTEWWANVAQNRNGMLVGYDGNTDFPGMNFGDGTANRIRDTDAIISLSGTGSYFLDPTVAPSLQTFALTQRNRTDGGVIEVGDLLFACNATSISLFQVTTVVGSNPFVISHGTGGGFVPGNNNDNLVSYLPNETELTDYVPTAFYIGVSSSGTSRSLFQMQLEVTDDRVASMQPQEMVEGVENMQIFYGVDTNATPDRIADVYVDASDVPVTNDTVVADWDRVVSVRIELLLASMEDNVLSEPQTYFFPNDTGDSATTGRSVTARNKRWYQTFSTTIGIRNRLP